MDDPSIQKYFVHLDEFRSRFATEEKSGEYGDFFEPERISYDDVKEFLQWGKMYVHGHDKFGRPVLTSHKTVDAAAPPYLSLDCAMFSVEKAIQYMKITGATQIVWLADLTGYSRGNSPPISHTLNILRTLQNNYPEILGAAVILDAPRIFSWLWSAISFAIDKRTTSKVHFVNGTPEEKYKILSRWFNPEQLDIRFGGTKVFKYVMEDVDGPGQREKMLAQVAAEKAALEQGLHDVKTSDLAGVDSLGEASTTE